MKKARIVPVRWLARLLLLLSGLAGLSFTAPQILEAQTPPVSLESPANLVAKALNGGQVDLTWDDRSSTENGFKMQRSSDRAFAKDLTSFSLIAGQTTYSDQTVRQATVYYYRLQAYNDTLVSDWSNIAIVVVPYLVPKAPSGLTASSSRAFQVNLIWHDNADNEAGFRVERASDDQFKSNLVAFTAAADVVNCTDNTVPAGTYYYRVFAYNKTADSSASNVVTVTVGNALDPPPILVGFDTAKVNLDGFNSNPASFQVDRLGVLQNQDFTLAFKDLSGTLAVAQNTTMLNASKQPLMELSYARPNLLPAPPAGKVLLGAVELGQAFSSFSRSVTVTMQYEPAALLSGQDPTKDLQVGQWDGTAWQIIGNQSVNTETNQISFTTTHFSVFAIFRPDVKAGPPFTISNLHVFPQYSDPGQTVVVWVEVQNNGPDPGNYTCVLKLNNKLEETRSLSLDVNERAQVDFNLVNEPYGSYNIDINGLTGTMVVRPPLPTVTATPTKPVATTTTAAPTTTELTATASPLPSLPPDNPVPISKPLLSNSGFELLLGGIVLIVIISLVVIFRKR
jgi:hypothetical protein